jgi:penicillin amidase
LPALRLKPAEEKPTAALRPDFVEPDLVLGSNSFAVDGAHSASGAPILANDMHLGLSVPTTWYRAELRWTDPAGQPRFATGVTLPGLPGIVAGSNGHLAWGFTNSAIDTSDVVIVETYADLQYRAPSGWRDIEDREEIIKVKGEPDEKFTARWTEWGPLLAPASDGTYYALRWTVHDPAAQNFTLTELDSVTTVADALALAPRIGMPNQNILLADRSGRIAWTLTGKIPRRVAFDGRLPVSWAYGDRKWDGWLDAPEIPTLADPADGVLWTANNRIVGGDAYARVGDGGYDNGLRAKSIRDALRTLTTERKANPADLLALQLEDRSAQLDRWQKLLLDVLTDEAVASDKSRRQLRDLTRAWNGHAAIDSSAYRIIRQFRTAVFARTLAPFADQPKQSYEKFRWGTMVEDSVWQLVTERPARLLNPAHRSWESLLLAAVDDVIADADKANLTLPNYTWGARNTLKMQHPFARQLPSWIGRLLSMPAQPLPGDSGLPRVQNATNGASQRLVVEPGREDHGIFHMPGGQSGHPLSPYFRAGHDDWVVGRPTPLLAGPAQHTLTLAP